MSSPRATLASLIILSSALLGCNENPETLSRTSKEWALPVITLSETTLANEYTVIGSVISDQRIDISSKIIGYIRTLAGSNANSLWRP